MLRAVVSSPTVASTRNNLLSAAREINVPGERWPLGGIAYTPHNYEGGFSWDPACGTPGLKDDGPTIPGAVEWDPAIIYWAERCEVITPAVLGDLGARAVAALDAHRSHLLEALLWTNVVEGADFGATHPNVGLADAPAVELNGGDPVGPVTAISLLVGALSTSLKGTRGVIHLPASALPFVDFYGGSVVVGNQLLAGSVDHQLAAGSGYPGTGPDGSAPGEGFAWFYATSPIDVRLSPSVVYEPIVDYQTNTAVARAEQAVVVSWDRRAHYAVLVCLGEPGPECAALTS